MVKNTFGGNKHKGQARKFVNAKPNNKLRVAEYDGEIYAVVLKLLGNNMFHAQCIDGKLRLGHIRGKFTGRKKRDSMLSPGVWVLVGERNFSNIEEGNNLTTSTHKTKNSTDKLEKCDLLEVYTESNKQSLKDTISMNWHELNYEDGSNQKNEVNDDTLIFENENDAELNKIMENMDKSIKISMNESNNENSKEEELINFDDI